MAEEILANPELVGEGDEDLLANLLGVEHPGGNTRSVGAAHLARLPDSRLSLALLAQIAADREQSLGVHTWRNPSTRAARWLSFLTSTGYCLAEIERIVVDAATADTTERVARSSNTEPTVTLERCICGEDTDCPDGWHSGDDLPCDCTPDCARDADDDTEDAAS